MPPAHEIAAAARRHGPRLFAVFLAWHVALLAGVYALLGDDPSFAWTQVLGAGELLAAFVPQLAAVRWLADGGRGSLLRAQLDGARRWLALLPAWLVYSNRLGVGLVLGVVPGLVWAVQGRFLVQAVALRPHAEPFAHSRAATRGAWWPMAGLSALAGLTWLARAAIDLVEAPTFVLILAGAAVSAAFAAAWAVVDTHVFLDRERRNGLV